MKTSSGRYPIEHSVGEIERLRMQAEAYAFDAEVMLDRIGVQQDWHCIDLGCGAGGITDLLSGRVGSEGRVLGLDADSAMVEAARTWAKDRGPKTVTYLHGDAYKTGLPREAFNLVHFR
ncbi:MAG: class I SAM-dependent methyltransferase, partial [SAR324 cluster bacterium]|nr:class I SAM-dependent methyltransferase [SAR324 cluster bacterium]